jgi:hypothetical protein
MSDHMNPGTTNPANQSYPAVKSSPAPRAPASASAKSSTGEMQFPALRTTRAAPSPTRGLPAEINAGHASHVRSQPAALAETRPPAKNIDACTNRPGGLPINVIIR